METFKYYSKLDLRQTQAAIKLVRDAFENNLEKALNIERVSAPLIVTADSGLNDDLNGVERPVSFDLGTLDGVTAVIVHSLAKWKRVALRHYGFSAGEGLYADMNAIRRDENFDSLHSIYVDQWDWEKVILKENRNVEFLQNTVKDIVCALADTLDEIKISFPQITTQLTREVFFITTQELEDMYPSLSPEERELEITKEKKTVFLMQIGDILKSGVKHDGRAPDYDDWKLNGDILVWNDVLGRQFEISSMGIRVDKDALIYQLEKTGTTDRLKYEYHRGILEDTLPLTIGGGIGQSRVCMFLLQKAHIGEVHASIWPDTMRKDCEAQGIYLL